MSSKVKIKFYSLCQDKRLKLLKILKQFRIKYSKLINPTSVPNEYVVFIHDKSDVFFLFYLRIVNCVYHCNVLFCICLIEFIFILTVLFNKSKIIFMYNYVEFKS